MQQLFFARPLRSLKQRCRPVLVAGLLVVALMMGMLARPPLAHAAPNGQQLVINTIYTYSVSISGYNQNGQYTTQCLPTASYANYDSNWWWVGSLSITPYASLDCSGGNLGPTTTDSASQQNQSGSWWSFNTDTNTISSYVQYAQRAATFEYLNVSLFVAQIYQESAFNPNAVSSAGAEGIAQLQPSTAQSLNVDPFDPVSALYAGAYYMQELLSYYGGDYAKALAAYDQGQQTVDNAVNAGGGNWLAYMPSEAQNYVNAIMYSAGALRVPGVKAISDITLTNRNSGLLLDVNGASTTAGTNAIQWYSNGGWNQQWNLQPVGNGYYKIFNLNSYQVLDVSGASTDPGASVIQWPDHDGANQQWSLQPADNGYYYIINSYSGQFLDVSGESTSAGTATDQWVEDDGWSQQWLIS